MHFGLTLIILMNKTNVILFKFLHHRIISNCKLKLQDND